MAEKSVFVIGGGLAGMAAAGELRRAGLSVRLFEMKRRLGGRAGSFEDSLTKQSIDYCQHVGMGCCTNLVQFLSQNGLWDEWQHESTLHFYSSKGEHLPFQGSSLPAPLHLNKLLASWPELTTRERLRIGRGIFAMMRLPSYSGSNEAAEAWLRRHGQCDETIRKFWSTIMVSALGEQIERVSICAARKVLIDGFASNRTAYELLVPKRPLVEIFSEKMAERLESEGVEIRLGARIDQIRVDDKENCLAPESSSLPSSLPEVGARREAIEKGSNCRLVLDGKELSADAILIAAPWHRLTSLFSTAGERPAKIDELIAKVELLESSPITGIHTWWDKPWLETPHAIFIDRFCQWIFAKPSPNSEAGEHYYQIVISGSQELPRGDSALVAKAVVEDLAETMPASRNAKLVRWKVVTDPHSVFSVNPESDAFRPAVDALADYGLWLAGDWTDTGWPATMEGAVRSGYLAAESILAKFERPRRLLAPDLNRGLLASWIIRK
jgi:predicted NAD/FAD-dependent oxidoreductase